MKSQEESSVDLALARSGFYQLLAGLFRYPDAAQLKGLKSEGMRSLCESLTRLNSGVSLRESVDGFLSVLPRISLEETEAQFARVFSHSLRGEAPLYELEYGKGALFQEPHRLGDLAGFYRAFGLEISAENVERPDHLAVELEFLHFLSFKEAHAWKHHGEERAKECVEAQKLFLREHLARWAFAFARRARKAAGEGFYAAAAAVLSGFLAEECARLDVPAGPAELDLRPVDEAEKDACISCSLPLNVETPH